MLDLSDPLVNFLNFVQGQVQPLPGPKGLLPDVFGFLCNEGVGCRVPFRPGSQGGHRTPRRQGEERVVERARPDGLQNL